MSSHLHRFAILAALMFASAPASSALLTYTAPMTGFTYNSDTASAAFNAQLGSSYTHISFSGASNTNGASYSSLVTFSTKESTTFGGSNTNLVNASSEIGPYGQATWDGILNIDFNGDVVAVGFGLVEFNVADEFIRVYDDTDALIGTFNDQLTGMFSFWGVAATGGQRIGRIELDGDHFAIQDIEFSETLNNGNHNVPEPASALLVGIGLLGLGAMRRRKA